MTHRIRNEQVAEAHVKVMQAMGTMAEEELDDRIQWDNKRIYLTHCSARKDDTLKETGTGVTPDMLYKSAPIRRFMKSCKSNRVNWAIFSDKYGIWFANDKHTWYEKDPDL